GFRGFSTPAYRGRVKPSRAAAMAVEKRSCTNVQRASPTASATRSRFYAVLSERKTQSQAVRGRVVTDVARLVRPELALELLVRQVDRVELQRDLGRDRIRDAQVDEGAGLDGAVLAEARL